MDNLELKLTKVHWWVPQGEVWRVRAGKARPAGRVQEKATLPRRGATVLT